MEFLLLGPLVVRDDGGRELMLSSPKQRALLSVLLLGAGEVVSRERLFDAIWPAGPPATAETALHGHVSQLRKLIGPDRVVTRPPGYCVPADASELDTLRFEGLVASAIKLGDPVERAEQLDRALALWRGEPLAEFAAHPFAKMALDRLSELRLVAVEERIAAEMEPGHSPAVIPELEALVTANPYRDRLRSLLMLALYHSGRQADALAVYRDGRTLLVDELGIEPGPELQALERRILNHDPALATAGATTRSLPQGTVTFVFTDIERSTQLLHELGSAGYAIQLAEHRRLLRDAFAAHHGVEVDAQGDAFFYAFARATDAVASAADAQRALSTHAVRVRIGIHTGEPTVTAEGYVGMDVHRVARIASVGHGGQTLVSDTTRKLVPDTPLRDLGEHRLKDLAAPERIYQLGAQPFPPLKSLYRTNLPIPATPFLGRERELAEIVALLAQGGVRLLTLTGPGGVGKTRLALQAAAEKTERCPDGVFWVPLAALRDPRLVIETAEQVLGAKAGLAEHIADRSLLLLFDNFEQVVEAAPALSELRAACPNLRLLVTSREPLHVEGEQEYAVSPFVREDAVVFFVDRARAVDPAFEADEAVAGICRRLDELPLAIELAAARVKALSSEQILARLEQRLPLLTRDARDLPERQRTLRATIEWSHELLDESERRLFARLSVFTGGCTLEAVEHVCEAELDTLQSLVDKSLLRRTGERYWMLETIREYAGEQLQQSSEGGGLHRRHADEYVVLAEHAASHLVLGGDDPTHWLDRLESEHDNLRAALDWLGQAGEGELEQRLVSSLWRFWQRHGYFEEARRRLERAVEADARPTEARAQVLYGAAVIAGDSGDYTASRRLFEEALALATFGDAVTAARVRMNLGAIARKEGDPERSREILEGAVHAFAELGEEQWVVFAMSSLAAAYVDLGDLARARELDEEVAARAHALGNAHLEAEALGALGEYAAREGRLQESVPLLKESMRIFLEFGDPVLIAGSLSRFARVLVASGHAEAAGEVFARAEILHEETGADAGGWLVFDTETRALIRALLDDAAYAEACERGRKLATGEAVALALDTLE